MSFFYFALGPHPQRLSRLAYSLAALVCNDYPLSAAIVRATPIGFELASRHQSPAPSHYFLPFLGFSTCATLIFLAATAFRTIT